jgi:hypothetical protein
MCALSLKPAFTFTKSHILLQHLEPHSKPREAYKSTSKSPDPQSEPCSPLPGDLILLQQNLGALETRVWRAHAAADAAASAVEVRL